MNKPDSIQAKFPRQEYISRINRVIDYIENNLDKELPLIVTSISRLVTGNYEIPHQLEANSG